MKQKKVFTTLAIAMLVLGADSLGVKAFRPVSETSNVEFYPEEWEEKTRTNSWEWGRSAIHWAYASNVTVGKENGEFDPDNSITRAEAVTMLTKIKEIDVSKYQGESKVFNDVNGAWYTSYVNAAYENKMVSGKGDGIFAPNDTLTRAEAATMIVKAMGYDVSKDSNAKFMDISDGWYTDYIRTAYEKKIVSGKSETKFDPNGNVTRAEYVMMLYNSIMGVNEKGMYSAVMISDAAKSFSVTKDDKVIMSYDSATKTVTGASKVIQGDDWQLIYFAPVDSFEIETKEGFLNRTRFFANGHEAMINVSGASKVIIAKDKTVTVYRDDASRKYSRVMVHLPSTMEMETSNEDNQPLVVEGFADPYEHAGREVNQCDYIKFKPKNDLLSLDVNVNFRYALSEGKKIENEDISLIENPLDHSTMLWVGEKSYDLKDGLKLDKDKFIGSFFKMDYDQDGKEECIVSVFPYSMYEKGKGMLFRIDIKEDDTAQVSQINDGTLLRITDNAFICGVDGALTFIDGEKTYPLNTEGTDYTILNKDMEALTRIQECDQRFTAAYDYDGDGQDEYVIIWKKYFLVNPGSDDETSCDDYLYLIDVKDGIAKMVQCPAVNIDELPKVKERIEAKGLKYGDSHLATYEFKDGKLYYGVYVYEDEESTSTLSGFYLGELKYNADGTFIFDQEQEGEYDLGVG